MNTFTKDEIVFTIDQIPVMIIDPEVREDGTVAVKIFGESHPISAHARLLYPTWRAAKIANLEKQIQSKKDLLAQCEEELNKYKNRDSDLTNCEGKDLGGY